MGAGSKPRPVRPAGKREGGQGGSRALLCPAREAEAHGTQGVREHPLTQMGASNPVSWGSVPQEPPRSTVNPVGDGPDERLSDDRKTQVCLDTGSEYLVYFSPPLRCPRKARVLSPGTGAQGASPGRGEGKRSLAKKWVTRKQVSKWAPSVVEGSPFHAILNSLPCQEPIVGTHNTTNHDLRAASPIRLP